MLLSECPYCHRKQSTKNKLCKQCGVALDKAKRSNKVKYWIGYRLPGGKQRLEVIGYSIEEARDAEGKRRSQKRENRIFDMLPEAKMSFLELTEWYLGLKGVKRLATYDRVKIALNNFNGSFGDTLVGNIKPVEIEDYQAQREEQGAAPATIDMEISITKTMVTKGFDNDMVSGHSLKVFRKVKRRLKKGSNARKRIISVDEYLRLADSARSHLRSILVTAYNTGMRKGELRNLTWSHIDWEKKFIRLPAEITKEGRPKIIPMNRHVVKELNNLPRTLRHDHVFTYKGQPISYKGSLKRSFKTACDRSGIPYGRKTPNGITFHDIRRTVKTNMLSAGVNKAHRDMILGHSLQGMDVHYLAPTEASLSEAMDRYVKWLDNQIANANQTAHQKTKI